jgi:hypothetical protein
MFTKNRMNNSNAWTKALRFGVFATLLAASAAATLMPDWATTLKAQSYYGSVDLQLTVQPSATVLRAGVDADLLVTLANAGPDDAHRARTIAALDGDAVANATSGCSEDPFGFPDCQLSTPLPAGGSADYLMTLAVSPLARGHLNVGVAAVSDDFETAPGQELVLLELPIEAHVNLSASATCARSYVPKLHPLPCQVTLRNSGQAAAVNPNFYVDVSNAAVLDLGCAAPRGEPCPAKIGSGWSVNTLMPGEAVMVYFNLTVDSPASVNSVRIDSRADSGSADEIEDSPLDNHDSITVAVPLFRDGFDGSW